MILNLEVTAPQPTASSGSSRQTFREEGGSIGRDNTNSWVLPHPKVSGHHATISHRNGAFYIEDRSRNGICLNSPTNRLVRGRPYVLTSGDRILIDPYEIRVVVSGQREAAGHNFSELSEVLSPDARFDQPRQIFSSGLDSPGQEIAGERDDIVDPLELLPSGPRRPAARQAPSAKGLEFGSPLDSHYQPPGAIAGPKPEPSGGPMVIPADYDPLAPDESPSGPFSIPGPPAHEPPAKRVSPERPASRPIVTPPQIVAPREPSNDERRPVAPRPESAGHSDLADALAGAGLASAEVTPELARDFGRILRIVVTGVMDVMRSRQQIKDEFRMHMTQFRPAENNPLKFSANVDDALHNMLVKRNPAYLPPVEAFEEAFHDLRNHQVAMLAGMRVAFKSMVAQFDADRLQEEFDRQLSKGLVPAKLRYWELYKERTREIVKDPEASFRRLFGDEFAEAYEEQLQQLKSRDRHAGPTPPQPPEPSDG